MGQLVANTDSASNEDFGNGHPDPNLAYAKALVKIMYCVDAPYFGDGVRTSEEPYTAVIANQATISATFSIIKQASALGCFPRLKVLHTSNDFSG